MKALRFHAAKDLRVEDIPPPPAPGLGQILMRNRFVGICGTDLHEYPTHSWPRTIELIASGAIPASRVVTKRIALDQAVAEGFEALLDPAGTQLKILIDLSR